MADLGRAKDFVAERGGPLDRALLNYILNGVPVPQEPLEELLAGQQADGGWVPPWAKTSGVSGVDVTCFKLAQADRAGLGPSHPLVARALSFLVERQRPEGCWQEEEALGVIAPPWARPGDEPALLYLTANAGFWVAVLGGQEGAARAAGYLLGRLSDGGGLPSFPHTHWLAAGLLWKTAHQAAAERILSYLAANLEDLKASNLAWLTTSLTVAGVPVSHPTVQAAAARLSGMQQDDGWVSEDGPDWDVHATLEAIRALRLGRG